MIEIDDEVLKAMRDDAFDTGYDAAVESLRELAEDEEDEETKAIMLQIADLLEKVKP